MMMMMLMMMISDDDDDDDDDDALTVYASHEVAPLHDVLTAYHASLEVGQDHDDWLLRLQRYYVD